MLNFTARLFYEIMRTIGGRQSIKIFRCFANSHEFQTGSYKTHLLKEPPPSKYLLTKEKALLYYKQMEECRRLENAAAQLYREHIIRGFCHLYAGQEAVAIGVRDAMRPTDLVITAYRCHALAYLLGSTLTGVLSELTGRISGCSRGKGGSMHMYTEKLYGGNGIVGAHVPVGNGMAFALKYKGIDGVSIILYGDGAANQGQVFESFNMAKLWGLPALFICENNHFGLGTKDERAAANINYYTRCEYIPGIWVNGMNVLDVKQAVDYALKYVSDNKSPMILEMDTYRYFGHSMSDPGTSYRTREEIQAVREQRDPLSQYKKLLLNSKLVSDQELKDIAMSVKKVIDDITKQAKSDPLPPNDEVAADVYVKYIWNNEYIRSPVYWKPFKHKNIVKALNVK